METLLTTLGFVAITALAVVLHMKRHRASAAGASRPAADVPSSPCPRCGARVPAGAAVCPSCGVPLQTFEIVAAAVRDSGAGAAEAASGGRLHAVVRADVCVGCGTCVEACPEPGAMRLEGKTAIVNLEFCKGHGRCAEACPVGGIVVSAGEAVQRVEVPALDANFQSNMPGLYIVGELGGRGLIKNAINEGKIAVEHVARELSLRGRPASNDPGLLDVIIVGSGPAGLSAGLEAHRCGLSYAVLERGAISDTIRKYPRHKFLLAEPVKVPLYGDLWVTDSSKESLLKVWESIIETTGLRVRTGHEVVGVAREGGVFRVQAGGEMFVARHVVLAMGRRGSPRRLGVPGEDLAKTLYDIVEMEGFAGRRVLVVGGGDSAVESAVGLSRQAGVDVTLSYRGDRFGRIKARNQEKIDATVRAGKVRLLFGSQVREIREDAVILDHAGRDVSLPNDDVIVRIGGEPPYEFLKRIGVQVIKKDVAIAGSSESVHA